MVLFMLYCSSVSLLFEDSIQYTTAKMRCYGRIFILYQRLDTIRP